MVQPAKVKADEVIEPPADAEMPLWQRARS
jgi:hypothetical protein